MMASSPHQGRALRSCVPCPAASTRRIAEAKASASIGHRRRRAITSTPPPRAENNNNSNSGGDPQQPGGISEDVLARLRAAETEAAKLREQLAKVQAPTESTSAASSAPPQSGNRIDGDGLSRESPFAPRSAEGSWLSESQVEFFTGGGVGETANGGSGGDDASTSEAAASVVTRRLVFGGIAAAGAAAFALVPTDALRLGRPQKPLFLYLTPLVRAGPLLDEAAKAGEEAEWTRLAGVLSRIQGSPCEVEQNLRAAAAHASIPAPQRAKLQGIARDAIEYVASIDYNSYFESVGGAGLRGGAREKAFADFSSKAATAAKGKIELFLNAMPRDDYEAAKSQVEALASMS